MALSDSRIVVLDVVASVASGMPVYYPVPDGMAADVELLGTQPGATTGAMNPIKRLQAFIQTHFMAAQ
jgi:hypothetical protein